MADTEIRCGHDPFAGRDISFPEPRYGGLFSRIGDDLNQSLIRSLTIDNDSTRRIDPGAAEQGQRGRSVTPVAHGGSSG